MFSPVCQRLRIMNDARILERKRLALLYRKGKKRNIKKVLDALAQHPEFSDSQVARLINSCDSEVGRVRRKFKIPPLSGHTNKPIPANVYLWEKWCSEDNKKLDLGICEINLHGDEHQRYSLIKQYKSCKRNYLHPRGKEKEHVHTDSPEYPSR